jgi:ABC-2 type transport system permease protein
MRSMLLIAGKDLRLRIRDRSAFIVGLVVPFALAFIFSLILGNVEEGPIDLSFGLVDLDGSGVAAQFADALGGLEDEGLLDLAIIADEISARAQLDAGDIGAAFIIPAGFGDAVEAGGGTAVDLIVDVNRPTTSAVANSIARSFASSIDGVRLAAATAAATGGDVGGTVAQVQAGPPAITLQSSEAANRQLDLTTFFVAGMAVFFLFFTVQFGVTSLLDEQREGTMSRLRAAPIHQWAVVGAKGLVSLVLGIVSMAVLVGASTVLLGAEWGHPGGVALLVVAGVISAIGIMAVVAAFARTPEGAGNLQAVIAVGLGMLGGVFFPAPLGDGILANLALLTPHRWFMTGLGDLAGGDGVAVVLPSVAALLAFGIVTGGIAWFGLRRGLGSR